MTEAPFAYEHDVARDIAKQLLAISPKVKAKARTKARIVTRVTAYDSRGRIKQFEKTAVPANDGSKVANKIIRNEFLIIAKTIADSGTDAENIAAYLRMCSLALGSTNFLERLPTLAKAEAPAAFFGRARRWKDARNALRGSAQLFTQEPV